MFSPSGSNPPSTPNYRRTLDSQPSTTPAGPPPSLFAPNSTTPAGPPPSSSRSSRNIQQTNPTSRIPAPKFQSSTLSNSYSPRTYTGPRTSTQAQTRRQPATFTRNPPNFFKAPSSSPPPEDEDDEDDEDKQDGSTSDGTDAEMESPKRRRAPVTSFKDSLQSITSRNPYSPRKIKAGASLGQSMLLTGQNSPPDTNSIAKGLAAAMPEATLKEPADLILGVEGNMQRLKAASQNGQTVEEDYPDIIADLCSLWTGYSDSIGRKSRKSDSIGPSDKEDAFVKATFVAELLLQLHHPPRGPSRQNLSASRFGRSSIISNRPLNSDKPEPTPKVLFDWLNRYHDPLANDIQEVFSETEGFSAADNFWDVVFSCLYRGRFLHVIKLFRGANWEVAACAVEDGYEDPGYYGRQLQQVEIAVNRMIALLEECPAVKSDDWDIKGADWTLFRHRVRHAKEELKAQADEGNGKIDDLFNAGDSMASDRRSVFGISTSSRTSETRLPSFVADSLNDMFGTLLGGPYEVMMSACDWVEAVVGVTAWWDGEDVSSGRNGVQRTQQIRPVDVTPLLAYRQRLAQALAHVWNQDDEQLQVNTSNPVEVGLACIFGHDVEGALTVLRAWSLPIAAAVAEIASTAGWLDTQNKKSQQHFARSFSQNDLMVLDYGINNGRDPSNIHDEIDINYAGLLQDKGLLTPPENSRKIEGWEIAVQMLNRLNNEATAKQKIGELFEQIPLDSEDTTKKLLELCQSLDLEDLARNIAQRFADKLSSTTNEYGSAIMFYARSHNIAKLKDVLDLLVSHCLVTSSAFPPIDEMDPKLKDLVTSPKQALSGLAFADEEAAALLSFYLSGYASLRRFYDLRDESSAGQRLNLKPLARTHEAAKALVAVITSAGDSIHGGLFDPDVEVVVQVDGLLVLLGEALYFLTQPTPIFTLDQVFALTQTTEDLQTVASRIQDQCEAVLKSTLANYHDGSLPQALSPVKGKQQSRSLQRETTGGTSGSGMTGSQFSLLGSSAYSSQELGASSASGSGSELWVRKPASGTKAGVRERGWDWRVGFARGTTAKDVLAVLRLALAKQISLGWQQEE